jgi:hypothetical protein
MKGGESVGYQGSLLFCKKKRDMVRLCSLLNKAAADSTDRGMKCAGLNIYEVARLQKNVIVQSPFQAESHIFHEGSYFVWWGGERGQQAQNEFLISRACRRMEWRPYWHTVLAKYVPVSEMMEGIKEGAAEEIRENEWIRTFRPGTDNHISLDLLDLL